MTPRAEKIAVALIVAASFVLFSLYSLATPLFEASDELWHYPLVQHLATGGGLPIQHIDQTDANAPWRQEGSQPPLYYAIATLVTLPIDSSNFREIRRINSHSDMGVPTRDGNINAILHTPAEAFPWTRATLAVRIVRLVSIVMSTVTVFFTYLVARELFPDDRWQTTDDDRPSSVIHRPSSLLRLATMIFVACVPMFAFISGSVNNDNAAILFSTLGLWWALRLMRLGDLSIRSAIVAGVVSALGALSKSSALGLIGLFGVAALLAIFGGRQTTDDRRQSSVVRRLSSFIIVTLVITLLISGWWFIRNQTLYGDLLGWNAFLDVVGRRVPRASLAQLWTEREGFVWAYWGIFGTLNVIMPPIVYTALNVLAAIAIIGAVWGLVSSIRRKVDDGRQTIDDGRRSSIVYRQIILCCTWVLLTFISFLRWTSLTPASQGRLLFPCIAVFAAVMAYGLWRIHRVVLWIGCGVMIAIGIAAPFLFIAPAYARPPSQWVERLPQPIHATFGNALQLVEAGSTTIVARPGDEVTLKLNWDLTAPLTRNYSVFVHLVDENDVIVAQRDMYPGQGNIATSEVPSGYLWSDYYTLRIPTLAPAPKKLQWAVGVYDFQTGERLELPNGKDRIKFGTIALQGPHPEPLLSYENGVELLDYTLAPSALSPGDTLTVTTKWRAARPIVQDLNISLQLLDDNANKIAQQDLGQPLTQWARSQTVETTHALQVSKNAPPGVYRLVLVWYLPNDFSRVGAYGADGQYAGDQIQLTKMRVH